jgi:DNA-binding IclR family transcriptional regulator
VHLLALGRSATEQFPLVERAAGAMEELRAATGESVQLYVVDGDARVCVAALESPHGLRTIVPVGAALALDRGSAGRALRGLVGERGWVESVEERERGVASVSAPVLAEDGTVVAALSVSGPMDRMGRSPGRRHGAAVVRAAAAVSGPPPT